MVPTSPAALKLALTIAGSDPSGGAGVQGDLRTFLALGIYGFSAVTALTAQNTRQISKVVAVDPDMVRKQIDSVLSDSKVDVVKIGMVYSREVIESVAECVRPLKVPIVVDPVLKAGTGARLLKQDAVKSLTENLFPVATLLTPNKAEAELLSGRTIKTVQDAALAGRDILKNGVKSVVVKGGHLRGKESVDSLVEFDGTTTLIRNRRIASERSHGSGCNFSAAAASFLAHGMSVRWSCFLAADFVQSTLAAAASFGRGESINIAPGFLSNAAERYEVISSLQDAVNRLVALKQFYQLIPETQTNFGYALSMARSTGDIAAVKGRIVRAGNQAIPVDRIEFGSSTHVSSAILAAMTRNPFLRSALNIKHDARLLEIAHKCGFKIASYDRSSEPKDSKHREGSTIPWGITTALNSTPDADMIYHLGDVGKEPMIIVFGRKPDDVVNKVERLASRF